MSRQTKSSIVTVGGLQLDVEYCGGEDDFELESAVIAYKDYDIKEFVDHLGSNAMLKLEELVFDELDGQGAFREEASEDDEDDNNDN